MLNDKQLASLIEGYEKAIQPDEIMLTMLKELQARRSKDYILKDIKTWASRLNTHNGQCRSNGDSVRMDCYPCKIKNEIVELTEILLDNKDKSSYSTDKGDL